MSWIDALHRCTGIKCNPPICGRLGITDLASWNRGENRDSFSVLRLYNSTESSWPVQYHLVLERASSGFRIKSSDSGRLGLRRSDEFSPNCVDHSAGPGRPGVHLRALCPQIPQPSGTGYAEAASLRPPGRQDRAAPLSRSANRFRQRQPAGCHFCIHLKSFYLR
jgi:hypothetical protein